MAKLVKTRARTACHVMSLFHMASQGPVATAGIAPLQASCAGERVAKEPRATKIQLRFCSSTAGNLGFAWVYGPVSEDSSYCEAFCNTLGRVRSRVPRAAEAWT